MILEKKEITYFSGKGKGHPLIGMQITYKCDNPQCEKIFKEGAGTPKKRLRRGKNHYCCLPCSAKHVVGVCAMNDCDRTIQTQRHRPARVADLCWKHRKALWRKEKTARDRKEMFDKMGGVCVCCGEKDSIYFQVDHINNDADYSGGSKSGAIKLREYLLEPDRFQLLCANCNHAKRMNNGNLYSPRDASHG